MLCPSHLEARASLPEHISAHALPLLLKPKTQEQLSLTLQPSHSQSHLFLVVSSPTPSSATLHCSPMSVLASLSAGDCHSPKGPTCPSFKHSSKSCFPSSMKLSQTFGSCIFYPSSPHHAPHRMVLVVSSQYLIFEVWLLMCQLNHQITGSQILVPKPGSISSIWEL